MRWLLLIVAFFVFPVNAQLAFPGAEGYGQNVTGGRGGQVIKVTNLNDSGPGSLRACTDATGPRTCHFEVYGDIMLTSPILIRNKDITIAGQTAPGQGVQLRCLNCVPMLIDTENWIIRHLRFRPGPHDASADTDNLDGLSVCYTARKCGGILDSVSVSFGVDETLAVPGQDFTSLTISNTIVSWPLMQANPPHTRLFHGMGLYPTGSCGFSLVGNLIAHAEERAPNISCSSHPFPNPGLPRTFGYRAGDVEVRNNIIYNPQHATIATFVNARNDPPIAEVWYNIVGNHAIAGDWTRQQTDFIDTVPDGIDVESHYPLRCRDRIDLLNPDCKVSVEANYCLQGNTVEGYPWTNGEFLAPNNANVVDSTDCVNNPVMDPQQNRGLTGPIIADRAQAEAAIISRVGPFWWNRDENDALVIETLQTRTGSKIDSPTELGTGGGTGYPILQGGPVPTDSDNDGIPNLIETACGWNPNASDGNLDSDANGWTNYEQYTFYAARDPGYDTSACSVAVVAPPSAPSNVNVTTTP